MLGLPVFYLANRRFSAGPQCVVAPCLPTLSFWRTAECAFRHRAGKTRLFPGGKKQTANLTLGRTLLQSSPSPPPKVHLGLRHRGCLRLTGMMDQGQPERRGRRGWIWCPRKSKWTLEGGGQETGQPRAVFRSPRALASASLNTDGFICTGECPG